ncbi:UNVERIFIED_CONTAM: hypothetical protein FKN15_000175 [Acipenser sinensis]
MPDFPMDSHNGNCRGTNTVIRAKVKEVRSRCHDVSAVVEVKEILKSSLVNIPRDIVTLYSSSGCLCPPLNANEEYIIMGYESEEQSRLLLVEGSIAEKWKDRLGKKVKAPKSIRVAPQLTQYGQAVSPLSSSCHRARPCPVPSCRGHASAAALPLQSKVQGEISSDVGLPQLSSSTPALIESASAFLRISWKAAAPRPQPFPVFPDFLEEVSTSWEHPASVPSVLKQASTLTLALEDAEKLGLAGFPPWTPPSRLWLRLRW